MDKYTSRLREEGLSAAAKYAKVPYLWGYYQLRDALTRLVNRHSMTGQFIQPGKPPLAANARQKGKHCILLSQLPWDSITQRPHHIARGLARKGVHVWYVNPEFIDRRSQTAPSVVKAEKNISVVRLATASPYQVHRDACDLKDVEAMVRQLESLVSGDVSVLTNHVFWTPLCEAVHWRVVYDCLDLVTGFAVTPKDVEGLEKRLAMRADHIVVTSKGLQERMKEYQGKLTMIPNGCDVSHFSKTPKGKRPLKHLNSPVVGYYGFFDIWFDRFLVRSLARRLPDTTFVLIGPVGDPRIYQLAKEPNIIMTGKVPYSELPNYLASIDVCVIPFRLLPVILATDPVKFYEMLAAGKPVVSSRLPSLVPFEKKGLVTLADTVDDWIQFIQKAYDTDSSKLHLARQRESGHHTWQQRLQQLSSALYAT